MTKSKDESNKERKFTASTALYAAASVVAVAGVTLLADNIFMFKSTVEQYVSQGYPAAAVMKSMIPSQLLPGVCEPIAVYGGIAAALVGIGIVNNKISKHLHIIDMKNADECGEALEESIQEEDAEAVEESTPEEDSDVNA